MHRDGAVPVAGGTRPAFGLQGARRLVHDVTLREDRDVPARMPIVRRDTLDRAVLMVMMVPRDEGGDPGARDRLKERITPWRSKVLTIVAPFISAPLSTFRTRPVGVMTCS